MTDFILFMHNDTTAAQRRPADEWDRYFASLRALGAFQGGSAIGDGLCLSKSAGLTPITAHISGYIRISAENLQAARALVIGNPIYEAGGTVEIRELPATG